MKNQPSYFIFNFGQKVVQLRFDQLGSLKECVIPEVKDANLGNVYKRQMGAILGRQNRERRGGERKVCCLSDLKKDLNLNGSRNSSTLSLLLVA
ncbi:hypothetical protein NC652_035801 [Populus alba x Populus x berolinensis]|uniref:Uncharacterized protein n=1 Tax=Populus alba x Populus x berolinensis TaxID=444605 RepID=A0AAD6PUV1_9ROSI|nr:hypothetical protein NC652_035801 [Populus alba x Populus x berolinensis]KAJ6967512.1 hypothetical protein NC653_035662 [Populus alba x Populus x berolinensis]KAJ6967520.1 hypothetical protein NC653_035667 [Populus alba x Populus x berolinensis]